MSDAAFPVAPDGLTTTWLSEVLGFDVRGFEVAYFSEGTGVMAWVTRLNLDTGPGHPDSIIAKFPSPVAGNREIATFYDMYGREVRFYQDIAPAVQLRAPACFHAAFDPATDDFVLLLEDLGHMRIGDQVAGCTIDDARSVVKTIARFHASAWQPQQFGELPSHDNPGQRAGMIGGLTAGWPVVAERFGDLIPAAAGNLIERVPDRVGPLLESMCRAPVCLTHADVRLDNIFFAANGDHHAAHGDTGIALVDWQSVCTSAPEQDLAYFLTQSVTADVRAADDLVRLYHDELVSSGIDYALTDCRERFRISAMYLVCYAVTIAGTLDLGNERGQALGRTIVANTFSALDEIDAFDLL